MQEIIAAAVHLEATYETRQPQLTQSSIEGSQEDVLMMADKSFTPEMVVKISADEKVIAHPRVMKHRRLLVLGSFLGGLLCHVRRSPHERHD